jgi:hypothetical protein
MHLIHVTFGFYQIAFSFMYHLFFFACWVFFLSLVLSTSLVMFQARPNHHHNLIYFSYRSCQNFLLGFNIKALLNLLLFYNYFNMKQIILGTHIFCFV